MRRTRILNIIAVVSLLGLSPWQMAYADPQNDDLKVQVKTLDERINQLENQLAEKNNPSGMTPRGYTQANAVDQWDPFLEMQRMLAQMNQLFQDSLDRGFGPGSASLTGPQADIKQTPDHYIVTMDLPGMEKNSINVEVKNGMLMVSGERSSQKEVNQGKQFFRQERSFGQFLRTMPLPEDAKSDDVKADYKNGVLEIKVGRAATGKPNGGKKIQIN